MERNYWLAVASGQHVERGLEGGFMQVCHGKGGPLKRIHPGDGVVYYSPTYTFRGNDRLQSFTAIGTVRNVAPYPFEMENGFCPMRRDVDWQKAHGVSILGLLEDLDLTRGIKNWGFPLRFGLVKITRRDFETIESAMTCAWAKSTA